MSIFFIHLGVVSFFLYIYIKKERKKTIYERSTFSSTVFSSDKKESAIQCLSFFFVHFLGVLLSSEGQ